MPILSEEQLTFTFDEQCQVSKYDDWSFVRNQFQSCCGGSKAIDMVCIDHDTTWLIEIKDYRRHRRSKPIDLGDEIAFKVRDTLAGLVAAKNNANDREEKVFAARALQSRSIKVVLHLEQPRKHSKLFPRVIDPRTVQQKLKKRLKAIDAHPRIVDQNTLSANMNWHVAG